MKEETPDSRGDEDGAVEFYVPATFQFSEKPGRVERILVGLFHDRDELEARIVTEEPTKEFYTPAMYQFSTEPGRIERFLNAVFAERGEQEFKTVPESFVDVFYLPATDSAEFRRHDDRNHDTVAPAAAVLQEQKRGQNPSR